MRDKKNFNVLRILEDLKKGRVICTKEYSKYLDVSQRSIQRYIEEIESFYRIKLLKTKKGCYSYLQISNIKEKIIDIKENEDFEKFADILGVLNKEVLEFLDIDKKIVEKMVENDIFLVKENPVENFLRIDIYKKLKQALKYKKIVDIEYFSNKEFYFENVKPLKIIFAEGNWYLAALSNDEINNGFKFLRVNFIKNIKEHSQSFQIDKEAIKFLESFQTLFSKYKVEPFEIILEVDKEVSRFFKVKKFMPSQEIVDENDEFISVKYFVTSDEEILMLVKKWFPFIKIKSPENLKDKFKKDLENYIKAVK